MKIVDGKVFGIPIRGQVSWLFLYWNRTCCGATASPSRPRTGRSTTCSPTPGSSSKPGNADFYPHRLRRGQRLRARRGRGAPLRGRVLRGAGRRGQEVHARLRRPASRPSAGSTTTPRPASSPRAPGAPPSSARARPPSSSATWPASGPPWPTTPRAPSSGRSTSSPRAPAGRRGGLPLHRHAADLGADEEQGRLLGAAQVDDHQAERGQHRPAAGGLADPRLPQGRLLRRPSCSTTPASPRARCRPTATTSSSRTPTSTRPTSAWSAPAGFQPILDKYMNDFMDLQPGADAGQHQADDHGDPARPRPAPPVAPAPVSPSVLDRPGQRRSPSCTKGCSPRPSPSPATTATRSRPTPRAPSGRVDLPGVVVHAPHAGLGRVEQGGGAQAGLPRLRRDRAPPLLPLRAGALGRRRRRRAGRRAASRTPR